MIPLDVDVTLERGGRTFRHLLRSERARVGIQGPSGAGKTTLLRVLAGLEPARGRVVVRGRALLDGARSVPPWERRVGWVPQDALLFPHVDVLGNLRWSGATEGEAVEVAEALGVAHLLRRRPRHLSGGERQRVALGRAVLAGPDLLLLDEPFTALDRAARDQAVAFVERHLGERGPVLVLVAHDLERTGLVDAIWEAGADGGLSRAS